MNSNPNLPNLESLQPSQDLYPDLGEFVLNTIADISEDNLEDFDKWSVLFEFLLSLFWTN